MRRPHRAQERSRYHGFTFHVAPDVTLEEDLAAAI
jgi:hypothetical protein